MRDDVGGEVLGGPAATRVGAMSSRSPWTSSTDMRTLVHMLTDDRPTADGTPADWFAGDPRSDHQRTLARVVRGV